MTLSMFKFVLKLTKINRLAVVSSFYTIGIPVGVIFERFLAPKYLTKVVQIFEFMFFL